VVHPSGFLPVRTGSDLHSLLATTCRDSDLFLQLRRPGALRGTCGRCEHHTLCGGSRSRAVPLAGDLPAADAWCACRPAGMSAAPA
jgi:MoaA/NifB/PqqE/SkfB family radical SAM enzyme